MYLTCKDHFICAGLFIEVLLLLGLKSYSWVQGLRLSLDPSDKDALKHFGNRPLYIAWDKGWSASSWKERAGKKRAGFGITQYKKFRITGSHMHEKHSRPWPTQAPEIRSEGEHAGSPGQPSRLISVNSTCLQIAGLKAMLFTSHFLSFSLCLILMNSRFFFSTIFAIKPWEVGLPW